ncbi:MAG: hypothetical protein ACKODH_04810 [Limisphaerales bacterium]
MEFLKNHYEKIILGVVLLLMAVGAVVLVLVVGSMQEELDKFKKNPVGGGGKPPPQENFTNLVKALQQATNPVTVEFTKVHKVFNPDAWYVNTNGDLIAGTNVGVGRLVVQSITPMQLKLWFDSVGGTPGRETVKVNVIREFAPTPQEQAKKSLTLSLTSTNIQNTLDAKSKLQVFAREIGGTPENPEAKLELVDPTKEPLKFTVSKTQGYTNVMEYVAFIVYPVESNFVWRAARKGQPMVFAGDTNIVVDITASNVVVRAISNDKTTTIPLVTNQPALPRPKAP